VGMAEDRLGRGRHAAVRRRGTGAGGGAGAGGGGRRWSASPYRALAGLKRRRRVPYALLLHHGGDEHCGARDGQAGGGEGRRGCWDAPRPRAGERWGCGCGWSRRERRRWGCGRWMSMAAEPRPVCSSAVVVYCR
jgi:hypothetical protein